MEFKGKDELQPPPRWLHTAVVIDEAVVVFGGAGNNLQMLNDVWMLDPRCEWARVWCGARVSTLTRTPRSVHLEGAAVHGRRAGAAGGPLGRRARRHGGRHRLRRHVLLVQAVQ